MDFQRFQSYARSYSTVPVYRKVLSDLLTPVSAYLRLSSGSQYSVLLESVEEGRHLARYSYIGRDPRIRLIHDDSGTRIDSPEGSTRSDEPFVRIIRRFSSEYTAPEIPEIPTFSGGWIGYHGYETIRWVEDIPTYQTTEGDVPDAVFMLFDTLVAFDHVKRETIISHNVRIDSSRSLREQYDNALALTSQVLSDLQRDIRPEVVPVNTRREMESNMSENEFCAAVQSAREHILAGDVFQLVMSQRFQRRSNASPFNIYRALRNVNPSPFMFFLDFDEFRIIGASPEVLVKVEGREMEVRPIAGTRPRGQTPQEDDAYAEELLADEKERAEHLMLVDLARNDVGRVCDFGSVHLDSFMHVERYSHVMHIVSDVKGTLSDGHDALDALLAGFPAGTVTGAPKIRAMEIIHDLEPTRRGIYSGSVGYIDLHGNLTTCIAIRTLIMQEDLISFQSGAGIVYDSVPEKEYEETKNKAKAIMRAIDFAEQGLQ